MNAEHIHMNCGGVGRYVRPHEVERWKAKGYVVTDEVATDESDEEFATAANRSRRAAPPSNKDGAP